MMQFYNTMRAQPERESRRAHDMACSLGGLSGVQPTMPRVATRMTAQGNIDATSSQQYYHLNLFLPLSDHLIAELQSKFTL